MFFMRIKGLAFVLSVLFVFSMPKAALSGERLILSVHPFLPAVELVKRFTPLAEYLSSKIGQPVILKITKDYNEAIEHAGTDASDITYLGPASYVIMTERYGRKPLLARQSVGGKPTFKGAIIVRHESPTKTLADLKGKKFAFGDENSTMSYIVPLSMLAGAGVGIEDLPDHAHMDNHNNVALGVLIGDYDAGAVKEEVFYDYEERGLRVVAWTPEISDHLFVASSRLSKEKITMLREAMSGLKESEDGRIVMTSIRPGISAMVPVADKDYDSLRNIFKILKEHGIDQ